MTNESQNYLKDYPTFNAITQKYGEKFCAAPWSTLYFESAGEVRFCCMAVDGKGDLRDESTDVSDIINSPKAMEVRKNFLNGTMLNRATSKEDLEVFKEDQTGEEALRYCDVCWDLEKRYNLPTDNRLSNTEWAKDVIDDLIKNTDADGYMHKQAPAWLDTVFSNKCNFACMGCDSTASTTIGKYDVAYQHRDGNFIEDNNVPYKEEDWLVSNVNTEALIKYIIEHKDTIDRIHFQGGEPFMMPEVYQTLDRLIEHELFKENGIRIWSHTNGSIRTYKDVDIFEKYLLKWEDRCDLTVSHDGCGKRGEYIRFGYRDKKWIEIFNRIIEHNSTATIQHSVNIFNILHQEECLEWYVNNCVIVKDKPGLVMNPWGGFPCYDFANIVLIPELFEDAISSLLRCVDKCKELDIFDNGDAYLRYATILENINIDTLSFEEDDKLKFTSSVTQFDKLRKTNFHETFPELKLWWDFCND